VRGTETLAFYDSYDIATLLSPGANWIAAEVHCHNTATSQAHPFEPGVLIQSQDGQIATDDTWQVQPADEWRSDVPLFTYQVGYMEWFDHRGEPQGWRVGADHAAWQPPSLLTTDHHIGGKQLLARDIPALFERAVLPVDIRAIASTPAIDNIGDAEVALRISQEPHLPLPIAIDCSELTGDSEHAVVISPQSLGAGVVILANFGAEINGRVEIDIDAPAGTILDIGYEEELKDGRLALTAFGYRFADRYILREGRQVAGNVFGSRGFRIVQLVLRNFNQQITIRAIHGIQRRYSYPRHATFECSDEQLNQIWAASVETMAACSTDVIVDCPWRENTLWFNDLLVESVTSLQAFGDPRLNARCLRLAASQPRSNGLLPGAVPAGFMPGLELEASKDSIVLLPTNLFFANILKEYLRYSGDESLVREMLIPLLRIHETFADWEDADGLIYPQKPYWNFIDWSYPHPPEPNRENAGVLNWFRVWSLTATADLLARLGFGQDARPFRDNAARIAASVDRRFWNEQRGCYVECEDAPDGLATQISHAVALLSGGVPDQHHAAAVAALNRDDLLAPELYMQHLVLRALVRFSNPAFALARVLRYWGPIVSIGSPTIGECGVHQPHAKSSFFGAASLCHGFSTTPIDFLQSVVLGVTPTSNGFRQCRIAPTPFDLSHASGIIPTPTGFLKINWQRTGSRVVLEIDLPDQVTATLPDGSSLYAGRHTVELSI